MSNHGSKPPETAQQRAMEQAAQRSARAAQGYLLAALLIPFVAYRGFHVPWPPVVFLHLALLGLALRHGWVWWTCRRQRHDQRSTENGRHAALASPTLQAQGSYPSRTVRVIPGPLEDQDTWTAVTQSMVQQELLGTFDERPVYRWLRWNDRWFRYETIDRLDVPINDREQHLVLGGLRYLQMPEDHPGPLGTNVQVSTNDEPPSLPPTSDVPPSGLNA